MGYFKVPFNQQRMTTSAKLLFQDRAIARQAFDQDRDYGVDIYGKPFDGYLNTMPLFLMEPVRTLRRGRSGEGIE